MARGFEVARKLLCSGGMNVPTPLTALLTLALLAAALPARALPPGGETDSVTPWARLVGEAEARSPAVARARAELARAEAELSAAERALPNPELEAEIGVGAPWAEGRSEVAVGVRQALPVFGTRQARVAEQRARVRAAEARLDAARQALRLDAGERAARLQGARAVAAMRQDLTALADEVVRATGAQVEAGQLPPSALNLAKVEAAAARAEALEAEREARLAELALCGRLALEPCAVGEVDPEIGGPMADDEAALVATAVARRAELAAAEREVEAAGHAVRGAERDRIPVPTVGLGWAREGEEVDGPFTREAEQRIELSVSVPLPLWGSGAAEVTAARAERRAAQADVEALRVAVAQQVRQAWTRLEAARARAAAWAETEPAVAETLAWLARGYEAGALSLESYLNQRDRLVRAELARAEARIELAAARLALARAVGTAAEDEGGTR